MNKTKQLYKLFESFRFFLFLLNCMKYSTNIFSLGYLISEVLQLNVCNNRTCTKVFILILFPFSMPIFSDKEHLIFQKEISSLFSSACCNLSLPVLEVDFIFSSTFSPSRPQVRGNTPKENKIQSYHFKEETR